MNLVNVVHSTYAIIRLHAIRLHDPELKFLFKKIIWIKTLGPRPKWKKTKRVKKGQTILKGFDHETLANANQPTNQFSPGERPSSAHCLWMWWRWSPNICDAPNKPWVLASDRCAFSSWMRARDCVRLFPKRHTDAWVTVSVIINYVNMNVNAPRWGDGVCVRFRDCVRHFRRVTYMRPLRHGISNANKQPLYHHQLHHYYDENDKYVNKVANYFLFSNVKHWKCFAIYLPMNNLDSVRNLFNWLSKCICLVERIKGKRREKNKLTICCVFDWNTLLYVVRYANYFTHVWYDARLVSGANGTRRIKSDWMNISRARHLPHIITRYNNSCLGMCIVAGRPDSGHLNYGQPIRWKKYLSKI